MSEENLRPYYKPKKHFGQNFLTSTGARRSIVNAGNLVAGDSVLEIGPGKGFLTEALVATGAHVVVLEKDRDLLPLLQEKFLHSTNLSYIEGDALTYEPAKDTHLSRGYKLIANIPYYITGAIFEHYLSNAHQPTCMVVLVQKEVAERVLARDGKQSLLSLSIHAYGTPSIVSRVSRGSFHPIPNVDSAILSIQNISRKRFTSNEHETTFFNLIRAGFAHKRKLLSSNLTALYPAEVVDELFAHAALPHNVRAEDVTIDAWISLSLLACSKTSTL